MQVTSRALGTIYIILGILLFISVAEGWMLRFVLAVFAVYAISYGLALRGMQSLTSFIMRWFDRTNYY